MSDNIATRIVRIENVTYARSFQTKIVGLLRAKKPHTLYFKTRFGIHTIGMRYPIDIIILNDLFLVKKVKSNLLPWKIFIWNPLWQHVIELPAGSIAQKKITLDIVIRIV